MEAFRKKLKTQCTCEIITEVILAVMLIVHFLVAFGIIPLANYIPGDEARENIYVEKLGIVILTLLVFNGIDIRRISKALQDEERLKARYIQSTDEREQMIFTASRSMGTRIFVLLGMIAVPICGYFNNTIATTIFICMVIQGLITLICESIYRKKY